jgi:CTP:molybdopterin cytidylyltransferase MocA
LDLAGRPVLQHVVTAAGDAGLDDVVVVVGHAAEEVAARVSLPSNARFVHNPDHPAGQSTSLRAGLLAASPTAQAAVVLLGDQPGVGPRSIDALIDAWRGGAGPVVQAAYQGARAHPILFDRSVWADMEEAAGDEGARAILARHPEWLTLVEVGGRPPDDIDTEEDYARARLSFEER